MMCLQPSDIPDSNPCRGIWFLQCPGAIPLCGERSGPQSGAPQVQLLHIWVWPGTCTTGFTSQLRPTHSPYLPSCIWWPADWWERDCDRLGQTQRGRHTAINSPGGEAKPIVGTKEFKCNESLLRHIHVGNAHRLRHITVSTELIWFVAWLSTYFPQQCCKVADCP